MLYERRRCLKVNRFNSKKEKKEKIVFEPSMSLYGWRGASGDVI